LSGTSQNASEIISDSRIALEQLGAIRKKTILPAAFYRDLVETVQGCVLATMNERAIGIAWLYDYSEPGPFLSLVPGDVVLKHLYVVKPFRGQDIASKIVNRACLLGRDLGFRKMYSVVRVNNHPSEAVFKHSGFKRVAEFRRSTIFGRRYLSSSVES
jgi:RimJ/RimL family protein N-acetyltransferase